MQCCICAFSPTLYSSKLARIWSCTAGFDVITYAFVKTIFPLLCVPDFLETFIGVIPCQNSKFSEKFPLDPLRFCWNFIKMGFLMNNEDLQSFSFGSFFVQKICPPKFCPPAAKNFLHFRPTLSPHIFGLKLLRLLKLGIFTEIFPLISDMVLNFWYHV